LMLGMLIGFCCGLYQGITKIVTCLFGCLCIPLGRAASALCQATVDCLSAVVSKCSRLCKDAAGWSNAHVFTPAGHCVQAIYIHTAAPIIHLTAAFYDSCKRCGRGVCTAIGHCMCVCAETSKRGACCVADAAYSKFFAPAGRCLRFCACTVFSVASQAACLSYQHLVAPIGKGMQICISSCVGALSRLACLTYRYMLAPIAMCVSAVCTGLSWGISTAAGIFYQYVLKPIGKAIFKCICALCRALWCCISSFTLAISRLATLLFVYVLKPIGGFLLCLARAICTGLFAMVQCVVAAFTTVSGCIACISWTVWSNLLVPIGRCITRTMTACTCAVEAFMTWCAGTVRDLYSWFVQAVWDAGRSMSGR